MKIGGNFMGNLPAASGNAMRDIASLVKGEVFSATVLDIFSGGVEIQLKNGQTIHAKAMNTAGIFKGEDLSFMVESNEKGQVHVKIADGAAKELMNMASKAFGEAQLPATDKNVALAKMLVENNLPLDAETLKAAAEGINMKSMTFDKLAFFLKEGVEITEGNLKQLNNSIIHKDGLTAEIGKLIQGISEMPESAEKLKAVLALAGDELQKMVQKESPALAKLIDAFQTLPEGADKQKVFQALMDRGIALPKEQGKLQSMLKNALHIDLENATGKDLNKLYQKLSDSTTKIAHLLESTGQNETALSAAKSIREAIHFQNEISEFKYYMQIPFTLQGQRGQGDLYVFKDREGQGGAKKAGTTALLSLELASLGHVEAFLMKTGRSVSCNFGLADDRMLSVFKENSFTLHKLLADKGMKLEQLSFMQLGEGFHLLKEPPDDSGRVQEQPRKYSFDAKA